MTAMRPEDGGCDLLIIGGTVLDGTGRPGIRADVAVAGDRVLAIGALRGMTAARVIDARGAFVCPGFIDVHGHSDLTVLSAPGAPSKVRQGVTTEVTGNCGLGAAPLTGLDSVGLGELRSAVSFIDTDPAVAWSWTSMAEYVARLSERRPGINIAPLVGHMPLRAGVAGLAEVPLSADQLGGLARAADAAMTEGAIGVSTGLMYAPLTAADADELVSLGRVVRDHDAVFAFHLRDYGDHLVPAVEEALAVGRATGCRIQLSHLVAVGRRNWGKVTAALELMDQARDDGVDVRADVYPYLAGSTTLTQLLPAWAQSGALDRLADDDCRDRIRRHWAESLLHEWDEIVISAAPTSPQVVGRSIADIAEDSGGEPGGVVLDLLIEGDSRVAMVAFGRSEQDLQAALRHPDVLIGSDGLALDPDGPTGAGRPHPRSYGCYPRLLGRYVRERGVVPLEAAVHRSTGLAADTFGLTDRGVLTPGAFADVVVFNPDTVADTATYDEPQRFPTGIESVVVNGRIVLEDGRHRGTYAGTVLTGTGASPPAVSPDGATCPRHGR